MRRVKRPYVLDGAEHHYDDGWPEPIDEHVEIRDPLLHSFLTIPEPGRAERTVTALSDSFAAIADRMVALPPLSWLDRILSGPVGRAK